MAKTSALNQRYQLYITEFPKIFLSGPLIDKKNDCVSISHNKCNIKVK